MDFSDLSEEELKNKLAGADDYEERAAIRAALRKLKKDRGEELGVASSRRGAAGYTRFGGSSGTSRGRAVTISVTSTTKPSSVESKSKQAKDDSQVKRVVSPLQNSTNTKTITVKSPEPVVNKSSAVKSPEPAVKSPVKSPEPVVSKSPGVTVKKVAEDEADFGIGKSTQSATSSKQPSSKTSEEKAEFQGFKLRKTGLSVKDKSRGTAASKNKTTNIDTARDTVSYTPPVKNTTKSTTRSNVSKQPNYISKSGRNASPDDASSSVTADKLQQYLVAYVNQALSLDPPLPSAGRPFYTTCSQPDIICSLLNHAVPNTVDMRALSPSQDPDSKESNMMLALESARAIGCRIGDNTTQMIDRGEPQAVRQLFMDIVRAHAVHLPQMEDEPRETFEDPAKLFAALGVSVGGVKDDTPDYSSPSPQVTPSPSSTPPLSASSTKRSSFDTNLSYEERVALRRAEREERRRQREVST
ncbi:uncharacterized protein [Dysidea avara]|uniref:uncharacterized protein isoform X2 n=1 Tax=Dysidea avara TaxID=196820 RepID=UPI00331B14ED